MVVIDLTIRRNPFELARDLRATIRPQPVRVVAMVRASDRLPGEAFDASVRAPLTADAHDGRDPGGIRTRDLYLERVASLARLDDGVVPRRQRVGV